MGWEARDFTADGVSQCDHNAGICLNHYIILASVYVYIHYHIVSVFKQHTHTIAV